MAKRSVKEAVKIERQEAEAWTLRQWLTGPYLAAALPFVPSYVTGAIGAALGAIGGQKHRTSRLIEEPSPLTERLRFKVPAEPGVVDRVYVGHAMDLEAFKGMQAAAEDRVGQFTGAQAKAFKTDAISRMEALFLSDDLLTRHIFVSGSSGLGKSVFFQSMEFQQIARGGGLIRFDAKGDAESAARTYAICKALGRENDLMWFNLDRTAISHTYNPLRGANVRELTSSLMKLYGEVNPSNEFFGKMARNALIAGLTCLNEQVPPLAINLSDLAALFSSPSLLLRYYQRMPQNTEEQRRAKEFVFTFVNQFIVTKQTRDGIVHEFADGKYTEALRGLTASLLDFSHSEWRVLANSYSPDINLYDAILDQKIVMISLPALADRESARLFGRLFVADLARAVGELYNRGERSLIPYLVMMDEYGSIADSSHTELWAQARGANVGLMAAVQGRGFLDQIDKTFTNNLITNAWTHMYFSQQDAESQQLAAKLAGTVVNRMATESVSTSFGKSFANSETGMLNDESHGKSSSIGFREDREDKILPEDFQLTEGEALMVSKFGTFRMFLPNGVFTVPVPPIGHESVNLPRYKQPDVPGYNLMSLVRNQEEYRVEDIVSRMPGLDQPGMHPSTIPDPPPR